MISINALCLLQAKAQKKNNELLILASARGYYNDVRPSQNVWHSDAEQNAALSDRTTKSVCTASI